MLLEFIVLSLRKKDGMSIWLFVFTVTNDQKENKYAVLRELKC